MKQYIIQYIFFFKFCLNPPLPHSDSCGYSPRHQQIYDRQRSGTAYKNKHGRRHGCFCSLVECKMEYLRHLEPWIASWDILLEPAYLLSNATEKLNGLKEDVLDLWRNDDWQIRLSWFLMVCTALNIIFIGIAWNIYGETISNMFFNKSRSPLHKRSKTNVLSSSMEDLIVKKIQ